MEDTFLGDSLDPIYTVVGTEQPESLYLNPFCVHILGRWCIYMPQDNLDGKAD